MSLHKKDDSPEQDPDHPIAVVSVGAVRTLGFRVRGHKGAIPEEDLYPLASGSLIVMPGGFQETHQHRVYKSDRECEPRVSWTFRKLDR